MKPASSGCLSEQGVNVEPDWLVFLPLQGQLSFTYLHQGYNLNICPSDTLRLPQAAWLHRDAQC